MADVSKVSELGLSSQVVTKEGYDSLVGKIGGKVDQRTGYGLSKNDLTDELKVKYDAMASQAAVSVSVNGVGATRGDDGSLSVTVGAGDVLRADGKTTVEDSLAAVAADASSAASDAAEAKASVPGVLVLGTTLTFKRGASSGGGSASGDGVSVDDVKALLETYATSEALTSLQTDVVNRLSTKVDKVDGKGLSANDFTDELKTKLEGIDLGGYAKTTDLDSYAKTTDLDSYVKVESGKGLSTNDFTTELKNKLEGIDLGGYAKTTDLDSYVKVESGKGLSANDFTTELKNKLEGIDLGDYVQTEDLETVEDSVNALSSQVSSANSRLEAIA
jgi:hypothetical protein